MTPKEIALKAHERHLDKFNKHMVRFRDACCLSKAECDELLGVINERLPGQGNMIAHWLRQCLCEAIAVIDCEDAAVFIEELNREKR